MATQALTNKLGETRHAIAIGAPYHKVLAHLETLAEMAAAEGLQVRCGMSGWVCLRRDYQMWG